MTLTETIQILKDHNEWRQGADTEPTDPKKLTEALEVAIHLLSFNKKDIKVHSAPELRWQDIK